MLEHQPEVLINGGDVGLTPEALAQYARTMERVSVPVLLSHGNHEMCSGYLPREQGGTAHASADMGGVHFVLLDVVRYFEPTEDHPSNWHVLGRRWVYWSGWLRIWRGWTGPLHWWWLAMCRYRRLFHSARVRHRIWPFPPMRLPGRGAC